MNLAVFVNSSDGFQECWHPFFELFIRYGGILCDAPVYLNTERAAYVWPGLNIKPTKVWPQQEMKRPIWSECLIRGLHAVSEEYVLYMQEDYFLHRKVDDLAISSATDILRNAPEVGAVHLGKYGPQFQKSRDYSDGFVEILLPARYLVSTQAAIWRKDVLLSLLRPWENGWMFEKFASVRARRSRQTFLSVNPMTLASQPPIDYIFTGIIKGQWKAECVPLFERHGIQMDFSRRGFYREKGHIKSRLEVFGKIMSLPTGALRSIVSLIR